MSETISWEAAVQKLRTIPEKADLVRDAYLDEDNLAAAKRFAAGEEFAEVLDLLGKRTKQTNPWQVLDIGAGNGIAAYAFAKAGHKVIALEPDPSSDVGAGAIQRLAESAALDITVLTNTAEEVSLLAASVDVVYVRQALHHADDLNKLLAEAFRVLRLGGLLMATREHVVDDDDQLAQFLESHPLNSWYGGEHAYRLSEYISAIGAAGFQLEQLLGPFETVINYFPTSKSQMSEQIQAAARHRLGARLGGAVGSRQWFQRLMAKWLSDRARQPGRLYSFLARKA